MGVLNFNIWDCRTCRDFESALRDSQIVADPNKHLTNVRSITTAKRVREKLLTTGAGEMLKIFP